MHGSVAILGILNERLQNGAAALQYMFTRTLVPASSAPYGYTPPLCLQVSGTGRRVVALDSYCGDGVGEALASRVHDPLVRC